MASELRVNTLKDASGNNSIGLSYVAEGSTKSWVNYDMTGTPSARDSFNHSSITDNGQGDGSLNFTSNFNAATYAFAGASCVNDSTNDSNIGIIGPRRVTDTGITTSSARMHHIYNSAGATTALFDTGVNGMMFVGDLA